MNPIESAIWTLETFGRMRAVADARVGPWIQIDHDREFTARLIEAVAVLEAAGMAERHPTRGEPRNVRITCKPDTTKPHNAACLPESATAEPGGHRDKRG